MGFIEIMDKFGIELSRVLFEYGLEITNVEEVMGEEYFPVYYYHISVPNYWSKSYKDNVFKICNSHMNNYCNEHNLWRTLLDSYIIFE